MKIRLLSAVAGALALLSSTSCSHTSWDQDLPDKPVYYFNSTEDDTFIAVNKIGTETWTTYRGAKYVLIYDENDNSATLQISDMQYGPAETDRLTMTLAYMPQASFTDPNKKGAKHSDPVTLGSGSTSSVTISNISICTLLDQQRTFGTKDDAQGNPVPVEVGAQTFISFTINGTYNVRVIQKQNYFYGVTTSVCTNGEFAPFTTTKANYRLTLDYKTMKANLTIENAQFVSNMPEGITMTFPAIDFTVTGNGISLLSSELTPVYNSIPMPAYKVTTLTGNVINEDRLTLNFTCPEVPIPMNSDNKYSFNVSANLPYSLSAR